MLKILVTHNHFPKERYNLTTIEHLQILMYQPTMESLAYIHMALAYEEMRTECKSPQFKLKNEPIQKPKSSSWLNWLQQKFIRNKPKKVPC